MTQREKLIRQGINPDSLVPVSTDGPRRVDVCSDGPNVSLQVPFVNVSNSVSLNGHGPGSLDNCKTTWYTESNTGTQAILNDP